jgi:hypothetical protein
MFPGFPGFPGAGGLLDSIRAIKDIMKEVEGFRPAADSATKKELQEIRDDLKALKAEVKAITVPRNLDKQLKEIKELIQEQRADFEDLRKAIRKSASFEEMQKKLKEKKTE